MKLNFLEYISLYDSKDEKPDQRWIQHWKKYIPLMLESNNYVHNGDCTNQPCPCTLCLLEDWLSNYKKYYLNSEEDYDFKEILNENT